MNAAAGLSCGSWNAEAAAANCGGGGNAVVVGLRITDVVGFGRLAGRMAGRGTPDQSNATHHLVSVVRIRIRTYL